MVARGRNEHVPWVSLVFLSRLMMGVPLSELSLRQYQSTQERFAKDVAKIALARAAVEGMASLGKVTVEIGRETALLFE